MHQPSGPCLYPGAHSLHFAPLRHCGVPFLQASQKALRAGAGSGKPALSEVERSSSSFAHRLSMRSALCRGHPPIGDGELAQGAPAVLVVVPFNAGPPAAGRWDALLQHGGGKATSRRQRVRCWPAGCFIQRRSIQALALAAIHIACASACPHIQQVAERSALACSW